VRSLAESHLKLFHTNAKERFNGRRTKMKRPLLMAIILCVMNSATIMGAIVVDFDDLNYEMVLTSSGYAGLTWEIGNQGYMGNQGYWIVPSSLSSYPHSYPHNAINAWGCTQLGISFSTAVDILGAYFAAQGGDVFGWTSGVRVHGYCEDTEVGVTPWFNDIDTHPDWFAMNLKGVNRIVIESIPVDHGGGWYGMDDLTYIPEPATPFLFGLGGLMIRRVKLKKRVRMLNAI